MSPYTIAMSDHQPSAQPAQQPTQPIQHNHALGIILKIGFFLIPFIIILIMSWVSGKAYTSSMADYALYSRYFAAGLFALFLMFAIILAAKEYDLYKNTHDQHALTLFKMSLVAVGIFALFLVLVIISIRVFKSLPEKQKVRIGAFNRTSNAVDTVYRIFKSG